MTDTIDSAGTVLYCHTEEDYYKAVESAGNRLVVVDCFAEWWVDSISKRVHCWLDLYVTFKTIMSTHRTYFANSQVPAMPTDRSRRGCLGPSTPRDSLCQGRRGQGSIHQNDSRGLCDAILLFSQGRKQGGMVYGCQCGPAEKGNCQWRPSRRDLFVLFHSMRIE